MIYELFPLWIKHKIYKDQEYISCRLRYERTPKLDGKKTY